MSIWLIRSGKHSEHEQKFLQESRVYATKSGLNVDVSKLSDSDALYEELKDRHPDYTKMQLKNLRSQVWAFAHKIETGDLIIMPSKLQRAIYIGEVIGGYHFAPNGPDPFFHWLPVKWIGEAIPRAQFRSDLIKSFDAYCTICRIKRNNAEDRIEVMRASNWSPDPGLRDNTDIKLPANPDAENDLEAFADLEQAAQRKIAELIRARFSGHGLARLINAILAAQGYTTYISPEGANGGIDVLAGTGALGFSSPRICVKVKSQESPVGQPEVDQLMVAMDHTEADEALFVAWGGFKSTVHRKLAIRYFRIRLWSRKEIIEQLLANYEKLDEDLRVELPLKRIWTVASPLPD